MKHESCLDLNLLVVTEGNLYRIFPSWLVFFSQKSSVKLAEGVILVVLLQLHLMSTFLKTTVWVRIGNNDQTLYIAKERIVEFFK